MQIEAAESLTDIFTDGVTMAVDTRRNEESILLTATLMEEGLDLDAEYHGLGFSRGSRWRSTTTTVTEFVRHYYTRGVLTRLTCTKGRTFKQISICWQGNVRP